MTVFAFDIAADKITRIWIIRNPSKLTRWARPSRLTVSVCRRGRYTT